MDDQIVAGARDAAKERGYEITSSAVQHQQDEYTGYSFAFDAAGEALRVDLLVSAEQVLRSGLTTRDYARHEILDALRDPAT
jgi:hypothetical protein